jgi:hypothetical protein
MGPTFGSLEEFGGASPFASINLIRSDGPFVVDFCYYGDWIKCIWILKVVQGYSAMSVWLIMAYFLLCCVSIQEIKFVFGCIHLLYECTPWYIYPCMVYMYMTLNEPCDMDLLVVA